MKKIYSLLGLIMLMVVTASAQTKIYAPTLNSPEDEKVSQMPDVELDWLAVTGITLDITYEAQLATMADFSDAVTYPRTEVTSVQTSDLLFGQTYYWRVRAYDQEEASAWSNIWSFQVTWTLLLTSVPSDGSMVFSNPEVSWRELTGVTKYEFQIDTSYAWHLGESGVTENLNATYVVDENTSWAVGNGGEILMNEGSGWTSVESGVSVDLFDVYFIDAMHGYIVGEGGTVLFYDGTTWTTQDAGITTDLFGVSFVDAENGVAVGAAGKAVVFAGGSWSAVTSGVTTDLNAVSMVAADNIWACGLSKKVVHFDGSTWTNEEVGSKDYFGISFQDANNGWVVGKTGNIYHYDGAAWFEQKTTVTKDLLAINVVNYKGYAVGKSGTVLTYNGGWSAVSSGTNLDLYGVSVLGDKGTIVGKSGTVIEKTDEGFNSPYLKTYSVSADSTTYTLGNLLFGQTYYYRMHAIHNTDTSAWSQVKSFTTYATVELDSPGDGDEVDLMNLFVWEKYKGVAEYTIEIDRSMDFSSPLIEYVDSTSINATTKYFGQDFYWRVMAENVNDVSMWSEVYSFTTKNSTTLVFPLDGAVDVSSCPRFIWEEIVGAPFYEVWVSETEDFADPVSGVVEEAFMQCSSQMEKNTTFYWKVRGITLMDTSSWSPVWSYTTEGYIGIDEYLNSEALSVYPNPSTGNFAMTLECYSAAKYQVNVADITGRIVYTEYVDCVPGENKVSVALTDVPQGIYNVIVSQGDESITKKILIK